MKNDSAVSKRPVQGHLVSNNLKSHIIELNSQLHSSCWQARQWYHTHLEEEKKATKQLSSDKARRVYQWKSKNYKRRYQHYIKVAISLIKYEEQVDDMGIFEETLKLLKDKNGTF